VPTGALEFYLAWEGLRDDQRRAITAELATRTDRKVDLSATPPLPMSEPSVPPTPPVSESVRRCAFDVIAAGETALLNDSTWTTCAGARAHGHGLDVSDLSNSPMVTDPLTVWTREIFKHNGGHSRS
jgi:hypothetical protein